MDLGDLGDDLRADERRLVARDLLAGLREFLGHEVVDDVPREIPKVFFRILAPAPGRPLDPGLQVLGVRKRPVEGAGYHAVAPVIPAEEASLVYAEHLGMG